MDASLKVPSAALMGVIAKLAIFVLLITRMVSMAVVPTPAAQRSSFQAARGPYRLGIRAPLQQQV
jgi:hypothetical protein